MPVPRSVLAFSSLFLPPVTVTSARAAALRTTIEIRHAAVRAVRLKVPPDQSASYRAFAKPLIVHRYAQNFSDSVGVA